MKTIIVGFSHHSTSLLSRLIRWVTASRISHCYVKVDVGGNVMVYQSSGLSVNYTAINVFLSKNVVVEEYAVDVSEEQWLKAKNFRATEAGKPYSMRQLAGFIWVLGMRKVGRNVKNPFADGNSSHICVETCVSQLGINIDGESVTPEDLRRWCEKNAKRV